MYNWSTDVSKIKLKEDRIIWRLEQIINFGAGRSKLNKKLLKKYWPNLKIDPQRKKFLEFVLWNKRKS